MWYNKNKVKKAPKRNAIFYGTTKTKSRKASYRKEANGQLQKEEGKKGKKENNAYNVSYLN